RQAGPIQVHPPVTVHGVQGGSGVRESRLAAAILCEPPGRALGRMDSTSAESTHAVFTNIPPGQTYVFAVVAFDEAGDYSPAFDFRTNMLELRSGPPDALGPEFTVLAESFQYRYRDGGYSDDPSRHVPLQVPSETV